MKKLLIFTVALAAVGLVRAAITPIEGDKEVGVVVAPILETAGSHILSVPFEKCMGNGDGTSVMLDELVSVNNLVSKTVVENASQADQLIVLTVSGPTDDPANTPIYYYYWLKDNGDTTKTWTALKTTILDNTEKTITPTAASLTPLARGQGVWLCRPSGASGTALYLKGQVATSGTTTVKKGLNLFSIGALANIDLNSADINWGSRYAGNGFSGMDILIMVNTDGTLGTKYYYHSNIGGGKWCTHPASGPPAEATDVMIGPSVGFWYNRSSTAPGDLTFTPVVTP